MTRENKLSIVIAFGLLIFVGMLVADHFSIASQREVADLGSHVPQPPLLRTGVLVEGVPTPDDPPTKINQAGDTIHIVKKGETLRSICRDAYGDSGLANAVAKWNTLTEPDSLQLGMPIALPSRASLVAGSINLPQPNTIAKVNTTQHDTPAMATYQVKKGDTLSEIAQKLLGTTKKTNLLVEYNKDVMPNPDRIRPGMMLRYPTTNQ